MDVENELGVIVLFAQEAKQAGYEIISIRVAFPDAVVRHHGIDYQTEFEFASSNFIAHNHDERKCDLIICFENDSSDFAIPVLALSDSNWKTARIEKANEFAVEISYWKRRARQEKRRADALQKTLSLERRGQTETELSQVTDWRHVPKIERQRIANMNTLDIINQYGVSERTARNWRNNALDTRNPAPNGSGKE